MQESGDPGIKVLGQYGLVFCVPGLFMSEDSKVSSWVECVHKEVPAAMPAPL